MNPLFESIKIKILLFFAAIALVVIGIVTSNIIEANRILNAFDKGTKQTMKDMQDNVKKMRDYEMK